MDVGKQANAVTNSPGAARARCTRTRRPAFFATTSLLVAILAASPSSSRADEVTSVLLPTAGSGNIAPRYVKRVHRSLRHAAQKLAGVSPAKNKAPADAAACMVDAACVARAGKSEGAQRAIGALITQKKGRSFELSLLVVESETGRELARKTFEIKNSRGLRRSPGADLREVFQRANKAHSLPASGQEESPKRSLTKTELQTQKTLVLPLGAGARVKRRYVKRTHDSIAAAVAEIDRVDLAEKPSADPSCASSPSCIADAGADAEVGRAVGIAIRKAGRGFTLTYIIVDVATRRVLSKITHSARHSTALRTVPGARLRDILAPGPADRGATGSAAWAPMSAEAAIAAVADGRTAIPIVVSGGPPRGPSELRSAPELPFVSCQGATSLPAAGKVPPAIIAPPVDKPTKLTCLARRRGVDSEFHLEVTPPGPGLYVSAPSRVHAQDPPVPLRAIVRTTKGTTAPKRLRARASGGLVRVEDGGRMSLELPPGKAPRMIVIALAAGKLAGGAFVPVRGLSKLKVEAERHSTVRVRIGGEWSGPINARRGVAWVPIEAPPGVEHAVVRATNRAGYATESIADLRVPEFPRIAAVAAESELLPGASTQIVIVAAAADGRPAPTDAQIAAVADLGVLGEPSPLGSGVWVAPYQAPSAAGQDEVVIRIQGDPDAGAMVLPLKTSESAEAREAATTVVQTTGAEEQPSRPRAPAGPPPPRFVLGAYADGGWVSDFDALDAGRVGAGVCVERAIGTVDISLGFGIEGFLGRGEGTLDDGRSGSWTLTGFSLPLMVRFRVRLPRGFGIFAGGGVLPARVSVELTPDSEAKDSYAETAMGVRWLAGFDGPVGPGRLHLGASYGTGRLSEGLVTGHFEGFAIMAGYAWWLSDLSR